MKKRKRRERDKCWSDRQTYLMRSKITEAVRLATCSSSNRYKLQSKATVLYQNLCTISQLRLPQTKTWPIKERRTLQLFSHSKQNRKRKIITPSKHMLTNDTFRRTLAILCVSHTVCDRNGTSSFSFHPPYPAHPLPFLSLFSSLFGVWVSHSCISFLLSARCDIFHALRTGFICLRNKREKQMLATLEKLWS